MKALINIFFRIHTCVNDTINLDGSILGILILIKTNAFFAIIANLGRIQITKITLTALYAASVIQYAACFPHSYLLPLF